MSVKSFKQKIKVTSGISQRLVKSCVNVANERGEMFNYFNA